MVPPGLLVQASVIFNHFRMFIMKLEIAFKIWVKISAMNCSIPAQNLKKYSMMFIFSPPLVFSPPFFALGGFSAKVPRPLLEGCPFESAFESVCRSGFRF